jgi:hypothetical protein
MFEDLIARDPSMTFDDAVTWAITDYKDDFESFWGLGHNERPGHVDADEHGRLLQLYRLATKFAQGGSSLISPQSFPLAKRATPEVLDREARARQGHVDEILQKLKEAVDSDTYWQLFWLLSPSVTDPRTRQAFFDTCLQLEADARFGSSPGKLASRMLGLIDAMARNPGDLTRAYLARVAACYVREMKPEFAVMARAALDAAIQERITDEAVKQAVGSRRDDRIDLERRIQACAQRGWFDSRELECATRIRETGRDAAHFSPGLEGDIDDLLDDLATVLKKLESVRT